jgi:hypothetical protein
MNGEKYAPPALYVPDHTKPFAMIVDIDGTVALHGDERGHYEYEKVSGDRPNWPIVDAVWKLAEEEGSPGYIALFVSGREDRCREDTIQWLRDRYLFCPSSDDALFMRKTGDHRPDYIIKREIFDEHIRHNYDVRLVVDDRTQVVKMWRSLGLTCLQVADGDF